VGVFGVGKADFLNKNRPQAFFDLKEYRTCIKVVNYAAFDELKIYCCLVITCNISFGPPEADAEGGKGISFYVES